MNILKYILCISLFSSCGQNGTNYTSKYDMNYGLQRSYTGKTQNQLVLDLSNPEGFTFSLSGEGFSSDTPLNQELPIRKSIQLSYLEEGSYFLTLKIHRTDGIGVVNQRLKWVYSLKKPKTVIATFQETATNSIGHLLFSPFLEADTQEIWVAGDVANHPNGQWYTIPKDLVLPIAISGSDGLKTIQVKHRNIFGNEGPESTVTIWKKTSVPKNCQASPLGSRSYKTDVKVLLSAENDGPLFYKFSGNVDESSWVSFEEQVDAIVNLSPGNGPKHVIASIKDIAGNRCPDIALDLVLDDTYPPYDLTVQNQLLWTDEFDITVVPRFDHTPDDTIEMFISGNIQDSEWTGTWLPLSDSVPIKLSPNDGNRFVYAQFRNQRGELSDRAYVSIFLKPFLRADRQSGNHWLLTPSHFRSLESMSIVGCQESYNNIQYQDQLPCTATGSVVRAEYMLSDKTTVSRSVNTP